MGCALSNGEFLYSTGRSSNDNVFCSNILRTQAFSGHEPSLKIMFSCLKQNCVVKVFCLLLQYFCSRLRHCIRFSYFHFIIRLLFSLCWSVLRVITAPIIGFMFLPWHAIRVITLLVLLGVFDCVHKQAVIFMRTIAFLVPYMYCMLTSMARHGFVRFVSVWSKKNVRICFTVKNLTRFTR